MKIEQSRPEAIEAWVYGSVGFIQGVYKEFVKPHIEDQPLAIYAVCGILGGLAVNKLLDH